ncbi:uncharacterized protein LOC130627593 [Hydractinia symbiolongicarpus]|uniref:uncharacterized protein LOC130627593 n=1 Tax=Hydractinia symbiolongicarpus TaxID=13093 RepID=UPI00254F346F|nr:uncharacterized protein LOC130627593 [Hydractinia symbiolongicarpus]
MIAAKVILFFMVCLSVCAAKEEKDVGAISCDQFKGSQKLCCLRHYGEYTYVKTCCGLTYSQRVRQVDAAKFEEGRKKYCICWCHAHPFPSCMRHCVLGNKRAARTEDADIFK